MGKKLFFYLFMAIFMLVILEGFAFVTVKLVDREDYFDHRQSVLQRLNERDLEKYTKSGADTLLGWRSFGPRTRAEDNCQGVPIEYTYDSAGARTYMDYDASSARVIVLGDSYTNGDEVADDAAYPARMASLLGASVANHGVGGYGPTQSVLNLEQNASRYPDAEVVVLGIQYENLYRMVNSYRPVLYSNSSDYSLKPYMAKGAIVPHPGAAAFASLDAFMDLAQAQFDTDFWAKPRARFPYLAALLKSLGSNYFVYRKLQKQLRSLGMPEYFLIFGDREVGLNLIELLNYYAKIAQQAGLQPVAVFIPRNRYDTSSAARFIEEHGAGIDKNLLLGDVGRHSDVSWEEFNLQELQGDNICHPSEYGYQVIADYIAEFLVTNKVWRSPIQSVQSGP